MVLVSLKSYEKKRLREPQHMVVEPVHLMLTFSLSSMGLSSLGMS